MRQPVDLWTSQERCPQPHRPNNIKRSKMLLEPEPGKCPRCPRTPVFDLSGPNRWGRAGVGVILLAAPRENYRRDHAINILPNVAATDLHHGAPIHGGGQES